MQHRANASYRPLRHKLIVGTPVNRLVKAGTCLAFLSMLLLLGGCPGGTSSSSNQPSCSQDYWVSTTGNDTTGDGSMSAPFRTLDRARQAVSADSKRGKCTIDVNVESGTYALTAPLKFDANDSGSPQAPVVYQAAPDSTAPVIISGGIPVSFASPCPPDISGYKCSGTVTDLPPHTLPRQFYVDDKRAIRARSTVNPLEPPVNPNYIRETDGYQQFIREPLSNPQLIEAITSTQWKMMRCPVASAPNATSSYPIKLVMAQPCWNNANTYPVPWNFQLLSWIENAPEFLDLPGSSNMWYLNPYSKELTYINPGDTPPQNAVLPVLQNLVEVVGTPSDPVTDISFKGLQFSYATWMGPNPATWQGPESATAPASTNGYVGDQSGNLLEGGGYAPNVIGHQKIVYKTPGNVTLRYARHITFDGDTFKHLGAVALELDTGSQDNQIVNNTFTDISSSAIEVGGFTPEDMRPDSAHETSGNLIDNNSISYTGRDYYDSAGIFVGYTTGTVVTHNTINHTPWSGIAIGWGWGLFDEGGFPGVPHATRNMWGTYDTPTIASNRKITSNLIENFLEKLWDGGAIYTNGSQGPNFANGLLIKLNVAINKRPAAGSNIFYTDGGSQYITLQQNVSLYNPVGTVDYGPCGYGSSIPLLCLETGIVSYGADMGGCRPVGHLKYIKNYFADTLTFYSPNICENDIIPPYPIDLTFKDNIQVTELSQVPSWILDQAGVQ
ncbi:MAG: right-handed parallel beta-helix repeat-containing protein [Gammaproteobacteria bacterium]